MFNIIVLGSGRSGTSMITGVLAKAGYFTGENSDYLKENKANPKGFYEDEEVNTINEDILFETLIHIPETIRKVFFPSRTFYRARWLARIPLQKKLSLINSLKKELKGLFLTSRFVIKTLVLVIHYQYGRTFLI